MLCLQYLIAYISTVTTCNKLLQCTKNNKEMKMYWSAEPSLHTELLSCHDYILIRTSNTCFMQAKAVHREKRRYSWTRIHPFGVNCLKASTDKVKQPNWLKKQKNGCHIQGWPFLDEFLLSPYWQISKWNSSWNFSMTYYAGTPVQELSVGLRVI